MQTKLQNTLNFDDVYFRDLTKAVLGAFQDKIWWIHNFTDENKLVTVPFYYSMSGDEKFLLDAFVDDVPSERVELDVNIIPRGHITLTNASAEFNKVRNPHVWLRSELDHDEETYAIYSKVKAIPMNTTFDVSIQLDSEIDIWKCYTKILDVFSLYKYMDFQHRGIYIEAVFAMPEGTDIEIPRDHDLSSDSTLTMKFTLEVKSYYPAIDLGYNGSLKEFQKILEGENFITKPGVFGTHFFMANKRVNWSNRIHDFNENNNITDHADNVKDLDDDGLDN